MLNIKRFSFNPFSENCFVVWDDKTKECAIIDAGCYYADEEEALADYIDKNGLTVKYMLATHLHLDHCFGCSYVSQRYGVKLSASADEAFLLDIMPQQAEMFGIKLNAPVPHISIAVKEGDRFTVGEYDFTAISVPGHSPGSIVYYCKSENIAFAGDVLFREGISRTDLPGGSYRMLAEGIRTKLFTLPENTRVCCGHGPDTTIGYERDFNMYL